jgi:hypothetical protein
MAAIVAGGSLGILQGSAALLGSAGQLGSAAHGRAGERVYLNASRGRTRSSSAAARTARS